jgi:2'-5' RNA ligase
MTFSIWLTPSYRDRKYLNKIIRNLAKKYAAPKFSAHITVFSGVSSLHKAKTAVQLVRCDPIKTRKISIGQSDYLWKTLFIRIKKEKQLENLYCTLQNRFDKNYAFMPHISLIYKKLDSTTKKTIKADLKIKNTFSFDTITIIKSSKNTQKWNKCYTFRLSATQRA